MRCIDKALEDWLNNFFELKRQKELVSSYCKTACKFLMKMEVHLNSELDREVHSDLKEQLKKKLDQAEFYFGAAGKIDLDL